MTWGKMRREDSCIKYPLILCIAGTWLCLDILLSISYYLDMNTQNFHIGAGAVSIDGTDIGETTPNGVVITYEPEIHFHKSGKYGNTPVKASLIGRTLTMEMELAETTLANMGKVFAGAEVVGTETVMFGGIPTEIEGVELELTPYDGTPPWRFHNAVPSSSVAMNYTVEDERVFKVTFTAMISSENSEDNNLAVVGFTS